MQTRNPFIDDLTKVANGAMGALTGMKDEVEARVRDQIAKILDGMDIPRRDEFDAVKAMAAKAREENEELKKQIAELQSAGGSLTPDIELLEVDARTLSHDDASIATIPIGRRVRLSGWPAAARDSSAHRHCRRNSGQDRNAGRVRTAACRRREPPAASRPISRHAG